MINALKNIFKSWGKSQRVKLTQQFIPLSFISNSYNEKNFREFICVAFGENPYINMVVPRITKIQAALPRSFKNEDNEVVAVDQQLINLINKPNKKTTRQEFYDKIDQLEKVTGNAIIYGISANPNQLSGDNEMGSTFSALGMDRYQELHIASIADVNINTDDGTENGVPISYQITNSSFNGATITVPEKDVLHLKNTNIISPSSNYGLSPLFGQQKAYTASTSTFEARNSSYTNGGATGVISPKGSEVVLLPDHQDMMDEEFNNRAGGTQNFGKVVFSGSPVDFTRITLSPEQLRLIESLPLDLRIICAVYDVDSVLFSDVQGTTFNNFEVAEKRIYETANRGGERIDEALSQWLIQENYGIEGVKYCIDKKDEAQEAKIKHRNTNEGKSQVNDIIFRYNSGNISRSSAQAILMENYAYSEDQSSILLGDPTQEESLTSEQEVISRQLNLRGLVGSISAIIQLQQSVANGLTQYDAAVNTIVNFYGYTEQEAIQMLGNESDLVNANIENTTI